METRKHDDALSPCEVLNVTSQFVCNLLQKEGVPWSVFMSIINDRSKNKNLAEFMIRGCPDYGADALEIENDEMNSLMLGDNYQPVEQVLLSMQCEYTSAQIKFMDRNLLSVKEVVKLGNRNSYILVPGPPIDMTFMDVVRHARVPVNCTQSEWFMSEKQTFTSSDFVKACEWIVLRKTEYPESDRKSWDAQYDLLEENDYVPNAAEVLWAMSVYYRVRSEKLFGRVRVRTSSVAHDGSHVTIGPFKSGGLEEESRIKVGDMSGDVASPSIGLATGRKFR